MDFTKLSEELKQAGELVAESTKKDKIIFEKNKKLVADMYLRIANINKNTEIMRENNKEMMEKLSKKIASEKCNNDR